MKLSLSMYSCVRAVQAGRLDLMGFVDYAAAQGVAGVELLDIFWQDAERELPQIKRRIAEAGLEVAVYSISNDFIRPEAGARAAELADLKRGVDIARELGVDLLRVFSGSARDGVSQSEGEAWILEGLSAGAAYAESRGISLALENHGRFAGRSDQVRAIIERVGSPALRINFDTGNFVPAGQDPVAAARELADWIVLVHLKDIRLAGADDTGHVFAGADGRMLTGAIIGAGLVDLAGVRAVMEGAGYAGWWSLEFEGAEEPLQIGVPQSLAAARRCCVEALNGVMMTVRRGMRYNRGDNYRGSGLMKRSTVELEISLEIEDHVRAIAEGENCSIESVLQEGLALLFGGDSIVEHQLDRLNGCTDEQLWALIHQRLTRAQDERLRELLDRGSDGTLTEQEHAELKYMVDLVDRQTLLRSRALALLQERGHDINHYLNATAEAD